MTVERFPETRELEEVLRRLVAEAGVDLTVVRRRTNPYTSTYPSEVVTCRLVRAEPAGERVTVESVRLLCKYETASADDAGPGDARGLAYEAFVNRQVAAPSGLTLPRLYGAHRDESTGATWLVFSFIDALRLSKSPWPASLEAAAAWIGRFHAYWDERIGDPSLAVLPRFDAAHYRDQLDRAFSFLGTSPPRLHPKTGWLIDRWTDIAAAVTDWLLSVRPTVIHGEFYPANILCADGAILPVDWESAAVAAGELDLATLTDAWDATSIALAVGAYVVARHPDGEVLPAGRLHAARLFVQLHWLAKGFDWEDRREWWVLDEARRASIALGVG